MSRSALCRTSMFVFFAVRSTLETSASNHTMAEASSASGLKASRLEHHRARQIVERHVEPRARANELLDFGVRLGAREIRIQLDEHDFRHRQASDARHLAGHELRDQRLGPLPGRREA